MAPADCAVTVAVTFVALVELVNVVVATPSEVVAFSTIFPAVVENTTSVPFGTGPFVSLFLTIAVIVDLDVPSDGISAGSAESVIAADVNETAVEARAP